MGKCGQRTKKIIKEVAKALAPTGIKLIGDIVGIVDQTDWTNAEKRERAVDMAKGLLPGVEEGVIRTGVEVTKRALKQGADALAELGAVEQDDMLVIDSDGDGIPDAPLTPS